MQAYLFGVCAPAPIRNEISALFCINVLRSGGDTVPGVHHEQDGEGNNADPNGALWTVPWGLVIHFSL